MFSKFWWSWFLFWFGLVCFLFVYFLIFFFCRAENFKLCLNVIDSFQLLY